MFIRMRLCGVAAFAIVLVLMSGAPAGSAGAFAQAPAQPPAQPDPGQPAAPAQPPAQPGPGQPSIAPLQLDLRYRLGVNTTWDYRLSATSTSTTRITSTTDPARPPTHLTQVSEADIVFGVQLGARRGDQAEVAFVIRKIDARSRDAKKRWHFHIGPQGHHTEVNGEKDAQIEGLDFWAAGADAPPSLNVAVARAQMAVRGEFRRTRVLLPEKKGGTEPPKSLVSFVNPAVLAPLALPPQPKPFRVVGVPRRAARGHEPSGDAQPGDAAPPARPKPESESWTMTVPLPLFGGFASSTPAELHARYRERFLATPRLGEVATPPGTPAEKVANHLYAVVDFTLVVANPPEGVTVREAQGHYAFNVTEGRTDHVVYELVTEHRDRSIAGRLIVTERRTRYRVQFVPPMPEPEPVAPKPGPNRRRRP